MPEPPSGTVTFLFTDIEGSTHLWDEHPDSMRLALTRHDEIASSVIVEFAGVLVKSRGEGDSLFAVFALATDAVAAASAFQIALHGEPWPESLPLRVRMALHTGEADVREGDYYGATVNRCARLRAIGHGGQVLLSDVTHDLCRDSLPSACTLKPLGEHRLKDLGRPETVFQLCYSNLPADFPPLKSLDNPELPNNLPQQVTSFIGREKELGELRGLLEKSRLVTLTGSGGCGKTRLALQAAAEILDGSGDGVWLVALASLSDANLVPQTVAGVLGLKEEPGKSLTETLTLHLKTKHLLLVLDNCEHLLSACATLSDSILRSCPKVLILATSREGMGTGGELTYRVPSLSLPDPKRETTPESLSQFEAVRLFVERAQFHQPQFTVTNQNAPALASVCHRLDGIPLAIELAAARVRNLSVEEVNQRLDQRFRLLTGGSRTALPRQQTLRSLIDWSYDLLNEPEKALLCRLSVFSGGWTLESAEQVCAGEPVEDWETLDLLTSLADKSLVVPQQHDGVTRFRLLETVRQYARDRLLESGDRKQWRDRHLVHFLALAEEAEPELAGAEQQVRLERLEAEHDNLRAALEWSSEVGADPKAGLRLAGSVWRFWDVRGYLGEGRRWLAGLLANIPAGGGDGRSAIRAKALHGAGVLAYRQGDYPAAHALHEESLAIRREMGDRWGIAGSLNSLGNVAYEQGDYPAAHALFEEGLAIRRELGARWGIARSLNILGIVAYEQGDYPAARALYKESLAIRRELGDRRGIALSLNNLGRVVHEQGDYPAARALHEESLAICRDVGDRRGIAGSLNNLGSVAYVQGDYPASRALFEESLAIRREMGDRRGISGSLEGLGPALAALDNPDRAARLWGYAERLRDEIGSPLPPNERPRYERQVADARIALADDAAFDAAWHEGRAMVLEQAIVLVLKA